jgi:septal ring factor EnvC (AmiA/AmiB activator)
VSNYYFDSPVQNISKKGNTDNPFLLEEEEELIRRELEEEDKKAAEAKKKREEEAAQRLKALQGKFFDPDVPEKNRVANSGTVSRRRRTINARD